MDVNWTQIGWGCVFGIIVGLLVYVVGTFLDWRRDRRWAQELNSPRPPLPTRAPKQRKSEESGPDAEA